MVRDLSLHIGRGEAYGLVGKSGCGKSTAALAVVRYLPRNGRVRGGRILLDGTGSPGARRTRAAPDAGAAYRDGLSGPRPRPEPVNPDRAADCRGLRRSSASRRARRSDRAIEMLRRVRIADPAQVMRATRISSPAACCSAWSSPWRWPSIRQLLILDEPTTGLDATVEAEVLDLIETLRAEISTSVLFISHNLGVIASMCARVGVLYAGA